MPTKYPLCIDLDGTLLHSDLLLEAAFAQLKQAPLAVLCWPRWLAGGKARLKAEIAERVELDIETLPYNLELLGYLARIYAAQTKPAPVIPLVFYHGATPHPAQRRLIEELGLAPDRQTCYQAYIPEFSYLLFDLAHAAPRAWESLAVRVFLAALDSVLRQDLTRMVEVLRLADQLLREPESTKIGNRSLPSPASGRGAGGEGRGFKDLPHHPSPLPHDMGERGLNVYQNCSCSVGISVSCYRVGTGAMANTIDVAALIKDGGYHDQCRTKIV